MYIYTDYYSLILLIEVQFSECMIVFLVFPPPGYMFLTILDNIQRDDIDNVEGPVQYYSDSFCKKDCTPWWPPIDYFCPARSDKEVSSL